jgi:hypothetical protein
MLLKMAKFKVKKNYNLYVFCITNSVAQEREGSSPHSQQPATDSCSELVESNPHPQANLPKIQSDPIFPPTPWLCVVIRNKY